METILKSSNYGFDETTSLAVIDIQARLVPALTERMAYKLVRYSSILIDLALDLELQIVYSEQYPKGLGETVEPLKSKLKKARRLEKTTFDLCASSNFSASMFLQTDSEEKVIKPNAANLNTIIVCGMETHICVLGSVCSLLDAGYRVLVPIDAVASRTKANYLNGLGLIEKAGATLVNTETIVFQTLKDSRSDRFKKYSKLIF